MRNIKVRVWDPIEKVFFHFDFNYANQKFSNGNRYTDGKSVPGLTLTVDDYLSKRDKFNWGYRERLTIQQFTGLVDINNKHIFEGDIVNFRIPGIPHGRYAEDLENQVVKYDEKLAAFTFGINEYCMLDNIVDLKVVSNIFETPEIINDK